MGIKMLITARMLLVEEAAILIDDSADENPEYMRGMVELIGNITRGAVATDHDGPDQVFENVEQEIRERFGA